MERVPLRLLSAGIALIALACDTGTEPSLLESLSEAFQSAPLGYSDGPSSFAPSSDSTALHWRPMGHHRGHGNGPGFGGPGRGHFFMGGGLGGLFLGDGFGPGFGHGRFGDGGLLSGTCTYDASTGRVTCDPMTRGGLTILKSAAYSDVNGQPQSAFDSLTTNTINARVEVSGTVVRRNHDTSTVQHASDRTVSGLASGSTERSVNGTSAGQETTVGSNNQGSFTALRVIGDTVQGIVIPIQTGMRPFPTAGTVIRSMQVTVTYEGQTPVVSTRREVVTYNGSATATVVITHDGETRTCTLPLPHGRLSCS